MRSKSEILEKARSLLEGARDDFVQKRTRCGYRNCSHNECTVVRKLGKVHYCRLKTDVTNDTRIEKLFICDSDEWACECDEYSCRNTEEEEKREFAEIIANPSRCGQLFPRLSALLWVLNDGRHREAVLPDDCQNSSPHGHEKNEEEDLNFLGRFIRRVCGGG